MAGKTHVLVIPYPSQGHINPMLQFSKHLTSKGVKVTLLLTPGAFSTNIQVQANFVNIVCISDGSGQGDEAEGMVAYVERFRAAVSLSLAELIDKQKSSDDDPAKVLVYDSGMPWALEIAQRFGLRGAPFFTQSCAVTAIYHHVYEGNFKLPLEGVMVALPSMPLLETNDLPSFISDTGTYPGLLSLIINQFSNIQKADWLLFNTFDKLEEEVVNWMTSQWPIKTIGPTIPSMYLDRRLENDKDYGLNLFQPGAEACIKWLDTMEKGSVVYASFGSLASLTENQMEEIACGLRNCGSYFLWVVRDSEESKLPRGFVEETSEKGLIVSWCSQVKVLAHRAVGCFMTHCGWNSTLEALSLGVPMVAVPQWTDQATNAKFIVDVWNVGLRVKANDKGIVTGEEIEVSVKEVMEGERGNELRRNAACWKELAKEAVDEGGSSANNIDQFVSEIVQLSSI
ncbi:mogroside IE synthase-like isoform X1 [Rhododendron vialii]|uniref:mogroside IE synthase-like isoform X1 n=1 Tax=Rhododendron vialii TaxID=182163 RepID=UPI00265DF034|nr:mogroside IE synthase-like isoform X1 [Rhododendron vialii]